MDAANRFETRSTFILWRLEYTLLLLISIGAFIYYWNEIRLIPFLILFLYIDLIGYIPGAIVYRLNNGKVPPFFYYLYNLTHNFISAAVVALLWAVFVEPEWALLAIPIHLFGDRAIFGNSFKSVKVCFEGKQHADFTNFENNFIVRDPYHLADESPLTIQPAITSDPATNKPNTIDILNRYANHPSAFLAMNIETQHHTVPGVQGFIPYRDDGKCLFQICGVFSDCEHEEQLLISFLQMAKSKDRKVCCVQVRAEQVELYQRCGFCVNQMGLSYCLELVKFTTAGTPFVSMRNKIKRAQKAGVIVHELGRDIPLDREIYNQMENITNEWLTSKGNKKLLQFMIGEMSQETMEHRRIFAAFLNQKMIGFVCYVPSYGDFSGWMHDLSRRTNNVPPGVMELINITAINRFKEESVPFLNFGLTPFCGINETLDHFPSRNRFVTWLFMKLEMYGQSVYPAISQVAYKRKWQPITETPEYVAFYKGFRLSHLFRLLKITQSI